MQWQCAALVQNVACQTWQVCVWEAIWTETRW